MVLYVLDAMRISPLAGKPIGATRVPLDEQGEPVLLVQGIKGII